MKYWPLIWRNLRRNRLRSALTGAAIAMAVALVCLLRTMPVGLNAILDRAASNTRISIHNKAGLVYTMPASYVQKVRALPGVIEATSWTWFGGAFDVDKGVTFPNFAVEPDTTPRVYSDYNLDPRAVEDFRRYRDGAIVGRKTLQRYGWKVGDLVTLHGTLFPVDLTFRVVGEIPDPQAVMLWFQREYLDQTLQAQGRRFDWVGMIWARVDDPGRVDAVMQQVDAMFRNSEAETAAETEKSFIGSFFSMLKGLMAVILVVTALVALCIVFIAANTASMNVRERTSEIAILKALGFGRRVIFATLVAEATLLSTAAGAVGAALSLLLTLVIKSTVASSSEQLGPLASFVVTRGILVEALFLALFIGMISGAVPSFGAARRNVAETLHELF